MKRYIVILSLLVSWGAFLAIGGTAGCGGAGSTGDSGDGGDPTTTDGVTAAEAGVIKGYIYTDSGSESLNIKGVSSAGGTPAANVTVSVITRPDLADDTDTTGYFEIREVPEGYWCIYASFESRGQQHEFGVCFSVTATAGADVGERTAAAESSLTCSSNDDCLDYDLPLACTVTLNLNSCTVTANCGGYVCQDSVCAYTSDHSYSNGPWDDPTQIICAEENGRSNYNDCMRPNLDGSCAVAQLCSSDSDCSSGSFCYGPDNHCMSEEVFSGIDEDWLVPCNHASDCSSDEDALSLWKNDGSGGGGWDGTWYCLPFNYGGSHCGSYCMSNVFTECTTDDECIEIYGGQFEEEYGTPMLSWANPVCADIGLSERHCVDATALACE